MLPTGDFTIAVDELAGFGVDLPPERVAIGVNFNDPTLSFGLVTFDPLQVNMETVRFGPLNAVPQIANVRDVNRDGLSDLLLRFRLREVGLGCDSTQAALTGVMFDGRQIYGQDAVQMVGCKARRPTK